MSVKTKTAEGPTLVPVPVTASQIEAVRRSITGHLVNLIAIGSYNADHGRLAGFMSDLRALDYIQPTKEDQPLPAQRPAITREQADREAQEYARQVKAREDSAIARVEA